MMMENHYSSRQGNENSKLNLPPGFRFHPTDEELISHYLSKKVNDPNFVALAIGVVDMNRVEPWNLPGHAKMEGKELYFFCLRDKKYPTGLRTNRATAAGYWKATGKDKEIYKDKILVGMKKTLVFYTGRAPKGEKSHWVSHEYRLEGKSNLHHSLKNAKNEWVICRVFDKDKTGGKKQHTNGNQMVSSSGLPPLMDTSAAYSGGTTTNSNTSIMPESGSHVPCFSNSIPGSFNNQEQQIFHPYFNNNPSPFMTAAAVSNPEAIFQRGNNFTNSLTWGQQQQQAAVVSAAQIQGNNYNNNNNYQFSRSFPVADNGIMSAYWENYEQNVMKQDYKTEERFSGSQETGLSTDMNTEISSVVSNHHLDMGNQKVEDQVAPSTSLGQQDLGQEGLDGWTF